MATISADTFLDSGTARTPGEAWTINGGTLTIRTDTRVHANAPAGMTGSLGSLTCSSTQGGGMLIDGTKVREVWFNSGSGTVPAIGTTISQGAVSGYLLGVWPNQTSAPTTPGSAMPAAGFLKFREVTGGTFAAGSLTGITASATGADVVSWLEIVADQSANFTFVGLGLGKKNIGVDYFLGTTNGTAGQTFQVPTNGSGANTHVPGIKIETSPGSNDYIPWPCLANAACGWTDVTVGTDARAKLAQSVGNGVVRIGSDGTNNIGYVPPAGCKVYVPNIFERQCLAATRAVNELPSSVLATRPELATTGGGKVEIDGTLSDWYYNIVNPATCIISNFFAVDTVVITNCTTDVSLDLVCLGILNSASASTFGINISFSKILKLFKIAVAKREFTVGTNYPILLTVCNGYKIGMYDKITAFVSLGGIRTTTIYGLTISNSSDFYGLKLNLIGGVLFITPGFNIQDIELDYSDTCKGTTYTTVSQNAATLANSENITFKSITFGLNGLVSQVNPFGNVVSGNGSKKVKIRGIGGYNNLALTTTNPPNNIFLPSNDTNVYIQRVYCNTRNSIVGSGNCSNVIVESSYTTTNRILNPVGKLGAIKGSMGGIPAAAVSGIVGNNINDYFQSATTGAIVWFGNAPVAENVANVQLTGASAFSGGGAIVMPNLTDTAIFTGTYYIKGHTSFANLAINLIGVNTANFDIYYQLDINDNNGFGGIWKLASAANLSAETISPSAGFNIKIKLAVNTASTTNSLAQIKINTVTSDVAQSTNLYPLDTALISLSGLIVGSRVFVYDVTNSVELINAVATATTFEQYAVYTSDATLQVRVMYATSTAAKIVYETLAIFTIDGASILVSQVDDAIYALNAIDGFSQTGFTIDDTTKIISVAKPGTGTPMLSHVTWQEAYAAETAWLMTAEGIRHYPRVLFAVDTANYRLLNGFKIKNTGSYPLIISGGYGVSGTTGLTADILDYSGGGITTVVEHVVPYQIASSSGGLTTTEHDKLMALPLNPLLTTDSRLNNLANADVATSSRMATFSYTAPDNAGIADTLAAINLRPTNPLLTTDSRLSTYATATNVTDAVTSLKGSGGIDLTQVKTVADSVDAKTSQLTFTGVNVNANAQVVSDKTGYGLTTGERSAIATEVEAHLLNEGDSQMLINAIVGAIGNQNVDEAVLVAAIRADLERTGGQLVSIHSVVDSVLTAVGLIPTATLTTTEHNQLMALPLASDVWTNPTRSLTDKANFELSAAANTAIRGAVEASTILAMDATVAARPTLVQIEASTILAKEATLTTKASQTSVSSIPTNPLLTTDSRLATYATTTQLNSAVAELKGSGGYDNTDLFNQIPAATDLTGIATTAQVNSARDSIKGANNIDLSQAKTSIDAIPTGTLLAVDYEAPDNGSIMTIKTQVNAINNVTQQVGFDVAGNVNARIKAADTGVIPAPDLSGLATTTQLNAAESSIKGTGNKDLTQVSASIPTAVNNASAVFDYVVENGKSFKQLFRSIKAVLYGKTTGVGTTTEVFLSDDASKPRVTTTFDSNNNRITVVDDGS